MRSKKLLCPQRDCCTKCLCDGKTFLPCIFSGYHRPRKTRVSRLYKLIYKSTHACPFAENVQKRTFPKAFDFGKTFFFACGRFSAVAPSPFFFVSIPISAPRSAPSPPVSSPPAAARILPRCGHRSRADRACRPAAAASTAPPMSCR